MLAKPYPFPFQNTLEQLLILASVLVVVLGLVYTFILKSSLVIEAILLAVLLGSLVGGVAYLIVKHRQGHATPNLAHTLSPPLEAPLLRLLRVARCV